MKWFGALGLAMLVAIALYAGYFVAQLGNGNQYVLASRAAGSLPWAGTAGESVICAYGGLVQKSPCSEKGPPAEMLALVPGLDLRIRYLCRVYPETSHFDCADKNMIGLAAILTVPAAAMVVLAMLSRALLPRRRRAAAAAFVFYGLCIVIGAAFLWHQAKLPNTTFSIGKMDEAMIVERSILAFTGTVIADGLMIALVVIGTVGVLIALASLMRRGASVPLAQQE